MKTFKGVIDADYQLKAWRFRLKALIRARHPKTRDYFTDKYA